MKQLFLIATMLLMFGAANAQTADYFVENGNIKMKKGGSTSTFAEGYSDPIIDFADGTLNGKSYLIFWTKSGNAKICTLRSDGSYSTMSNFECQCRNASQPISKIKFAEGNSLIITCQNGDRYKKTYSSGGGSSESRY